MSNQEAPLVKLNKTKVRRWNWNSCLTIVGIMIALIFVTPPVAQFGYCHGWWLKPSRWAYYWWLCDCGPEFEQSLYPDNIEIVVSACSDPWEATLSPDGRYMIAGLGATGKSTLLDFVTGQKREWLYPFGSQVDVEFWTDRLVRVWDVNQKNNLLIDVTDGSIINFTIFKTSQKNNQLIIPAEAIQVLKRANNVVVQMDLLRLSWPWIPIPNKIQARITFHSIQKILKNNWKPCYQQMV